MKIESSFSRKCFIKSASLLPVVVLVLMKHFLEKEGSIFILIDVSRQIYLAIFRLCFLCWSGSATWLRCLPQCPVEDSACLCSVSAFERSIWSSSLWFEEPLLLDHRCQYLWEFWNGCRLLCLQREKATDL